MGNFSHFNVEHDLTGRNDWEGLPPTVAAESQRTVILWLRRLLDSIPAGKLKRLSWYLPFELTAENVRAICDRHPQLDLSTSQLYCDHHRADFQQLSNLHVGLPTRCNCAALQIAEARGTLRSVTGDREENRGFEEAVQALFLLEERLQLGLMESSLLTTLDLTMVDFSTCGDAVPSIFQSLRTLRLYDCLMFEGILAAVELSGANLRTFHFRFGVLGEDCLDLENFITACTPLEDLRVVTVVSKDCPMIIPSCVLPHMQSLKCLVWDVQYEDSTYPPGLEDGFEYFVGTIGDHH